MSKAYIKFLAEYKVIKGFDKQIDYVMNTLHDMAEEKRFKEFQDILDDAQPKNFYESSAAITIALVGKWYGHKLNTNQYIDRAIDYYAKQKNLKYAKELFERFRGVYRPTFGFERELFGITE